jgi:DNA-binding MarR family transcriptional regulator
MHTQPTNHYALTKKQRDILNLLYRFRFATSEQLSQTLNIGKSTINKRLQLMMELKYIGRRYSPEYRLLRKHASYYLLAEGSKALKNLKSKRYSPRVLRNIAKDDIASNQFVTHWLAMFDIYRTLRSQYGDILQFFTKSQVATVLYFPKQLPDAHLQLGTDKLFLLDLLHQAEPFFLATRKVMRYIGYADEDKWPEKHEFPKLLLVCDTPSLQKRLLKRIERKIEEADNLELKFYITTLAELENDIWYNMADPEKQLTLGSIL